MKIHEYHWEDEWKNFEGLNFFGQVSWYNEKRAISYVLEKLNLPQNSKILDFGCGTGRTLMFWKSMFPYSVGIDVSKSAIKMCLNKSFKLNKDVFLMDTRHTLFKKNCFDISFGEGVLEHYSDFSKLVKEICRITKKYIILTQPNHFSFLGKFLSIKGRDVGEFSYRIEDFEKELKKHRFNMVYHKPFNFGEHWIIVFRKD